MNNLNTYQQQAVQANWRIKEAIIYAIGSLCDELIKYEDLYLSLEPTIFVHVLPELTSAQPFMRMRTCWFYKEFGNFGFRQEGHFKQAAKSIYMLLFDQELSVRFMAAISLQKFFNIEEIAQMLKSSLGILLSIYLKLMSDIDSEELVAALGKIVSHFKDDIGPYALKLTEQLASAYKRSYQVTGDDNGDGALTAVGCMAAIRCILESIKDQKESVARIEELIQPIILHSLTPDGMDNIEEALSCIALVLYHGNQNGVSHNIWKIFPQLLYVIVGDDKDGGGYGFEYLSQVAISIQNFIIKDP